MGQDGSGATKGSKGDQKLGSRIGDCQVESRMPGEIIFNQGAFLMVPNSRVMVAVFRPKLGMTLRSQVMLSANHVMNEWDDLNQ